MSVLPDDFDEQCVMAALPILRAVAREIVSNPLSADDLVEETLRQAIAAVNQKPDEADVLSWLLGIMTRVRRH